MIMLEKISLQMPECMKVFDGTFCGIKDDFMGAIMTPLDYWFFNSFGAIFWGIVVFITWRQSSNSLYAGIMGILIATGITIANREIIGIGLLLLVLSGTVAVYHMFVNKASDR